MERMPFRAGVEAELQTVIATASAEAVSTDWRERLPVLTGKKVVLRDLRPSDATSLFTLLTTEEVARFISPPPSTVEGFERFIAWAHRQRSAGAYACFAITLPDNDTAIGIFQVRELEPGFGTAEWGFAIGSGFWGTGIFQEGAQLILEFAFECIGVHRLEARAAVKNGRGNSALQKIGAVQEGVLRKSFLRNGEYLDQVLYAIVDDDWRATRRPMTPTVRVH
jgi:RimJ/RimL family protein N-acetyltransferase